MRKAMVALLAALLLVLAAPVSVGAHDDTARGESAAGWEPRGWDDEIPQPAPGASPTRTTRLSGAGVSAGAVATGAEPFRESVATVGVGQPRPRQARTQSRPAGKTAAVLQVFRC